MNLQQTAAGLLKKFQTAYRNKTTKLQEMQLEREAHDDEKAEAETRTRHLKMQLGDMARKAAEAEAVMQALMEELNTEKRLRMEERLAREKIMVLSSDSSTISEDLGVEDDQRRRTWRRSGETLKSDLGFETDDESMEAASLFSRPRSPTLGGSILEINAFDSPTPVVQTKIMALETPRPLRPSQPQMTTFQKLFKGISNDPSRIDDSHKVSGCQNCQGQESSVAWDTASLLRIENRGLKHRVGELETLVEEALDVVNSVGL